MQLSFAMLGTCELEPEQKSTSHSWVCESHTYTRKTHVRDLISIFICYGAEDPPRDLHLLSKDATLRALQL